MQVLAQHYTNLINYATYKGLEIEPIQLSEGATHLPAMELLQTFDQIYKQTEDAYLGLHYGVFLNLSALGSVYDISLASSTIHQALHLWSDYAVNNFPIIRFDSGFEDNKFTLALTNVLPRTPIIDQMMDAIFTFVYRELKIMLGGKQIEITLPYEDLTEYQKWYKTNVKTGNKYTFSFELGMEEAINQQRKTAIELLLPAFLKVLASPNKSYRPFSTVVREMTLNMSTPDLPTIDQVASQFWMTNRTLQRRLKEEQMTFRKIKNDIKKELYFYLKKLGRLREMERYLTFDADRS